MRYADVAASEIAGRQENREREEEEEGGGGRISDKHVIMPAVTTELTQHENLRWTSEQIPAYK